MTHAEFDAFYRRYVRLVYAIALASVAEETLAEDVVSTVFVRSWRHAGTLAAMPSAEVLRWLGETTRNASKNALRDRSRRPVTTSIAFDVAAVETLEPELRIDLARALASLSEEDRVLVLLRYSTGLNSREIGEAMGMPDGTVRRRLSQCRDALYSRLAPALMETR